MQNPTVSFVVPCYRLAHLLPECITAIFSQTYGDFEVLIMDDCSPDQTGEVAATFRDARVRYIRNEKNLGHLRNYNKGIDLSRGRYVWLISADDYLRKPYVLERYVALLEKNPKVGYVFCPSVGVRDGRETRTLGRNSQTRDRDRIIPGHALLKRLISSNFVMTPSGLVRRDCYDKISLFPLDMPWCGDWYLWCLFALYRDAAYFEEPMVCYREHHTLSMTSKLTSESLDACAAEEIAVPWMIRKRAQEEGYSRAAKDCLFGVAQTYARAIVGERYRDSSYFLNYQLLEDSLRRNSEDESERDWIRTCVFGKMGNECFWQGDAVSAKKFYQMALERGPWTVSVGIKRLLLSLGKPGDLIRRMVLSIR